MIGLRPSISRIVRLNEVGTELGCHGILRVRLLPRYHTLLIMYHYLQIYVVRSLIRDTSALSQTITNRP